MRLFIELKTRVLAKGASNNKAPHAPQFELELRYAREVKKVMQITKKL